MADTNPYMEKIDFDFSDIEELLTKENKKNMTSVAIPPRKRGASGPDPVLKFKMAKHVPAIFLTDFLNTARKFAVPQPTDGESGLFVVDVTLLHVVTHGYIQENLTTLPALMTTDENDKEILDLVRTLELGEYLAEHVSAYEEAFDQLYELGMKECRLYAEALNKYSSNFVAQATDIQKILNDPSVWGLVERSVGVKPDEVFPEA